MRDCNTMINPNWLKEKKNIHMSVKIATKIFQYLRINLRNLSGLLKKKQGRLKWKSWYSKDVSSP